MLSFCLFTLRTKANDCEAFRGLNLMLEFAVPSIVRSTLSSCYGNTLKLLSWELWCTSWCRCAVEGRRCKLRTFMRLPQLQEQTPTLHLLCGRYRVRDLGTQMKRQGSQLEELRFPWGNNTDTWRTRAGPLTECQCVQVQWGCWQKAVRECFRRLCGRVGFAWQTRGWTEMMFPLRKRLG